MILTPAEQQIALTILGRGSHSLAEMRFAQRLRREGFALGDLVFRLELVLTETAAAFARPANKERARLRRELGEKTPDRKPLKALPRGVGPTVPLVPHAPTMNEYNGLTAWQKEKLREAVDGVVLTAKAGWTNWRMGVTRRAVLERGKPKAVVEGGRRRVVVVTRYSAGAPDELSCDAIGGKIPIDRLVHADVLRGDTAEWLARVPVWTPAPREQGRVVVDVHEFAPLRG